jgi:hypothetical protein
MQTNNWPKTGRNAPCPCGSGKKFKRCHGSIEAEAAPNHARPPFPPDETLRTLFAQKEAEQRQRQQQQGLGRPIISFESHGYRLVCVGNRIFWSQKWKTFQDFLRDYPMQLFGEPWVAKQRKLAPEAQHPYVQWRRRAFEDHKRLATSLGGISTGPVTAAISSIMSLAYNLYLIHHNLPANPKSEALCKKLVKRLKNPDHFWGALYETYAFSLFAVAGFDMELEDESDRSSTHCEFTARSKSGRTYSIECKGRNRTTVPTNGDGTPRIDDETLGLSKKLKDALSKSSSHERVVFLDMDLPTITRLDQIEAVANFAVPKLHELEGTMQIDGQPAPPAYVFVTNIPDHRNTGDASFGLQAFATGFKIPNFGQGAVHHGMHEMMKAREQHADILSLQEAAKVRHTFPSTFDGENPALAFSKDQIPRLKIGNWYAVPDENGAEIQAQLCEGLVMEDKKMAHCIYRTTAGTYVHYTNTLTDDEIHAYKLHPETFFGVEKDNQTKKAETVVDWFDFLFKSYQHTSKEKLLEFLAGMPDIGELAKQTQRDLAITYCERMAIHIHSGNAMKKPKAA